MKKTSKTPEPAPRDAGASKLQKRTLADLQPGPRETKVKAGGAYCGRSR